MTGVTFATLLQASVLLIAAGKADQVDSYAEAHRTASKTGKPMVVMVGTSWCRPCQEMEKTVLPQCLRRGLFRRVTFCLVDADRQQKLARKLTGGGPFPQLIMYRMTRRGWARRKLVGGQTVETVEKFINQGIAADEAAEKPSAQEQPKPPKQKPAEKAADKPEVRQVSNR